MLARTFHARTSPLRVFLLAALAAVTLGSVLAAAACADEDETTGGDVTPITFMAGFRPQANLAFVAVYVAVDQGFYADEGLEVNVQHSSGQDEHLKLLLDGEIDFTTGTAAQVIRRRAEDLPVRAVALYGQRGEQGYVALASSGIETPEDFRGHSVGFKAGVVPAELHALLATAGLTADDVELMGVGFDPRVFIEGQVDVYPVFLNNEPDTIRRAGVDINVIDPHDYGVPTLGLTLLTHANTVSERPDVVERFLRATLRGAEYASEHVDEAVEIVGEYADAADPEHQRFLLERDLSDAERADGMGRADPEQWQALQQLLIDYGVIDSEVDLATVFDGSFVDALYNDDGTLRLGQ